ncbi:MAG: hypothetical protein ACRCS3_15685 [Paracoccaceae bacterium]
MPMQNHIKTTLFLTFALFSPAAYANDLESLCQEQESTYGPITCATALDFGGQAAHLREIFLNRHFGVTPGATGFTASTSGGTSAPYTGVFSLGAQTTTGNFSGNMQALVLGADRGLADGSFLGIMLQLGQSEVTAPFSPTVERREILIGPYFSSNLGDDMFLDGYILVGQPDYTVGGVPSNGESLQGSVTLSKGIEQGGRNYVLYSSLAIKREEPAPTQEIDATILTIGGSMLSEDKRIANGWRQNYARLEVDFGAYDDSIGTGPIKYVAPRITIGTDIALDSGGTINLSANASAASDATYIIGLRAAYNLQF